MARVDALAQDLLAQNRSGPEMAIIGTLSAYWVVPSDPCSSYHQRLEPIT